MSSDLPDLGELPAVPPLPVGALVAELASYVGSGVVVDRCVRLLDGEPRERHLDVLPWLTGLDFADGQPTRDRSRWKDFWPATWGARGLLYVWDDLAASAVVGGLAERQEPAGWRVPEMCLKVIARRDLPGAGDGAARWATYRLARVRAQAFRALAVVGDTEHVEVVRAALSDPDVHVRRQAEAALARLTERLDLPEELG